MKHTPGPWETRNNYPQPNIDIVADNGRKVVCETITNNHEPNALLIAAAPDLLKAARQVVLRYQAKTYQSMTACIDDLALAITKAEGK